jgi:hypothetical protein
LKTNPPTFTPTAEPLDVEHWLRVLEQKFLLLIVTDEQKVRFVTQQLLGSASAWWDTFDAMQQVDHQVTWQEFTTTFREYFIPVGVLNRKLSEFLDLEQGSMSVMEYAKKIQPFGIVINAF